MAPYPTYKQKSSHETTYKERYRIDMSNHERKKLPPFLKTVYLSNREIRLLLAGLYSLNMSEEEVQGTLWKKLLFEKLHKKTRRKKD